MLVFALLIQGCGASMPPMAPMGRSYDGGSPSQGKVAAAPSPSSTAEMADSDEDNIPDAPDLAPLPSPSEERLAQGPSPSKQEQQVDAKTTPSPQGNRAVDQRSPILIYTANFQMAVFDVQPSLIEAERITREVGGFVTRRSDRQIIIRVPAARFQETIGRIEKIGEVTQRDVVAQDVTEEYLDTEIRLRNARAMRDRLEQLLAKAHTVQDSLMIERELNRVAAEIERMEGRLKYLRDRAAFSTITISFDSQKLIKPPPTVHLPFPWLTRPNLSRLLSL